MLISVLLLVITILSIYIHKQYLENFKNEVQDIVNEGKDIQENLEKILDQSLDVSQTILDRVEMSNLASDKNTQPLQSNEKGQKINSNKSNSNKIRVYQLAKELNMTSKEMVNRLNQLGLKINNHMNILEEEKANWVRDILKINEEMNKNTNSNKSNISLFLKRNDKNIIDVNHLDELKAVDPYIAVKTLNEKGYDIKEIAQLLGRGQGEVSLILNLNKTKKAL